MNAPTPGVSADARDDERIPPSEMERLEDAAWYDAALRRAHVPQLTWRAVVTGMILGFLLSFTNIYVGLMTGWLFGVGLTSSIVSFTAWNALHRARLVKTPMTILETNCMQTTASAAGYSTGEPLLRAIPALLLLSVTTENPGGTKLPWLVMAAWVLCLAILGVTLAIPLKRSFINQERLRFPSGTATAVMLHGFYDHGADAVARGRALLQAAAFSAFVPLLRDLRIVASLDAAGKLARRALVPASSRIFDLLPRVSIGARAYRLSDLGLKLDHGLILVGAGAIVGVRVTLSMVASSLALTFVLTPIAMQWAWRSPGGAVLTAVTTPALAWREIGVWFGAPFLAASALTAMALRWRSLVSALRPLVVRGRGSPVDTRGARLEVPASWFVAGVLTAGTAIVFLAWRCFEIPPRYGVLAVLLASVFSIVSCRTVGETDLSASSAMGKLTQLTYGVLLPQSTTANLMTASITSGASVSASELLNDLKTGHLLGARPRSQFIAQLAGALTGTFASCLGYALLVPDARVFNGVDGAEPQFAAPSAQQWKAIALIFKYGIENLHPLARIGLAVGAAAGVAFALADARVTRYRRFVPSPTGIGLGLVIPFRSLLSMLIGALLARAWQARSPEQAERYTLSIASGLIAGESLVGVIVTVVNEFILS